MLVEAEAEATGKHCWRVWKALRQNRKVMSFAFDLHASVRCRLSTKYQQIARQGAQDNLKDHAHRATQQLT
eukprot:1134250-Pelagomonas_calceolata.AAC.13